MSSVRSAVASVNISLYTCTVHSVIAGRGMSCQQPAMEQSWCATAGMAVAEIQRNTAVAMTVAARQLDREATAPMARYAGQGSECIRLEEWQSKSAECMTHLHELPSCNHIVHVLIKLTKQVTNGGQTSSNTLQ